MTPTNEYLKFLHSIELEDAIVLKNKIEARDPQSWKLVVINEFLEQNKAPEILDDGEPEFTSNLKIEKKSLLSLMNIPSDEKIFFCEVEGASMQGIGINNTDKLMVVQADKLKEGEIGIFKINNDYFVKRYKTGNFDDIILKSHNINFKDINIKKQDLQIIGKVHSLIKKID